MADPVGSGYVASLSRPGGNFTGFTNFEYTIGSRWLQILKDITPAVTRVAIVYSPEQQAYVLSCPKSNGWLGRSVFASLRPGYTMTPQRLSA